MSAPPRYHISLDGWRGIAALMVALHHFPTVSLLYSSSLIKNAWVFVDFFFVLSGFVIAANYADKLSQKFSIAKFMLLRLGRLYPLHFFMLMAFIASECVFYYAQGLIPSANRQYFAGTTAPMGILTSLTLTQGWGFHEGLVWNGVAWSISVEILAYFVFAMLVCSFPRYRNLSMVVLIALSLALISTHKLIDIARCIMGFGVGVLLNTLYLKTMNIKLSRAIFTIFECTVVALAITFVIYLDLFPAHIFTAFAFAPAVYIFAFDKGLLSRMLSTRLFVFIGTLSYSIYMIHPFVQSRLMLPAALLVQKLTGLQFVGHNAVYPDAGSVWGNTVLQAYAATLIMLLLVIILSYFTYKFIETPGRNAMRRYLQRETHDPI